MKLLLLSIGLTAFCASAADYNTPASVTLEHVIKKTTNATPRVIEHVADGVTNILHSYEIVTHDITEQVTRIPVGEVLTTTHVAQTVPGNQRQSPAAVGNST